MRVIGVDPGFGRCGIAVMDDTSGKPELCFSTCVETSPKDPYQLRLRTIADAVSDIIERFSPDEIALEEVFFSRNQKTAIQVAETRGAIIYLASLRGIPVSEFNPGKVKIAVAGDGRADKSQIETMVRRLIQLTKEPDFDDEFDAIALCITFLAEYRSRPG